MGQTYDVVGAEEGAQEIVAMTRNLIVDGQILQTDAWYRGMGKYTLQVLRSLSETPTSEIKVSIIFNDTIKCDPSRYETIKFLCPNVEQIQYQLPVPTDDAANVEKEEGADGYVAALEACLDKDFAEQDNYYLMTSLFYFDFFAEFPAGYRRLLLFYDLTPVLFWRDLGGYFPPNLYMRRFERLLQTECIFSISQTTRHDLIKVLGLDPARVMNINGGFTKVSEKKKKPTNFKIPAKYILFPTGDLPHKNNEVAVKGFKKYYKESEDPVPLLITSRFQSRSKRVLKKISKHIIFTENVSDEELEWLYENASVVLFASKYEGLGLPILDAVANQKPIVASKIPVFEEMSKQAFYYFKVDNYKDLAGAISRAMRAENFPKRAAHYPSILEKYTWQNTCNLLIKGLNDIVLESGKKEEASANPKLRIAVACIHPGLNVQIGRQAEALHNSLSQLFEVDYYFDANGNHYRDMERPTFLDYFLNRPHDIIKLDKYTYPQYATVIYLLDETSLPSRVAQRAVALPGMAVTRFLHNKKLGHQEAMFKDIVLKRQYSIHELHEHSYAAYQALAEALYKDVLQHSSYN